VDIRLSGSESAKQASNRLAVRQNGEIVRQFLPQLAFRNAALIPSLP
jgi:hypothetical protein